MNTKNKPFILLLLAILFNSCASFNYKTNLIEIQNTNPANLEKKKVNTLLNYTFTKNNGKAVNVLDTVYLERPFTSFDNIIQKSIDTISNINSIKTFTNLPINFKDVNKKEEKSSLLQTTDYIIDIKINDSYIQDAGFIFTLFYPGKIQNNYSFNIEIYDKNKNLVFKTTRTGYINRWYTLWFIHPCLFPILIIFDPNKKIDKLYKDVFDNIFLEIEAKNILE